MATVAAALNVSAFGNVKRTAKFDIENVWAYIRCRLALLWQIFFRTFCDELFTMRAGSW